MSLRVNYRDNNKENADMYHAQKVYPDSARKYPALKKQAFNEIKNIIPHQLFATPMKSMNVKKCILNIIPEQKSKTKNVESKKALNAFENDNLDFIDAFDFDKFCCKKPTLSDEEIWGRMNMMDDSFLNRVIGDEVCTSDSDIDDKLTHSLDINDFNNNFDDLDNDILEMDHIFTACDPVLDEFNITKLPKNFDIIY